ncbi:MAG: 2,3-bisphosphoglycerate-independent phosphoglycerate mutase [Parcubacteria group bacterium Gr01-1014_33]|nr:MAG: 2,3-bisphosphoglycerate-independent phosphoglycerate mutase [Parcubacteria group bacterium Gr01-1014_33]
MPRFKPLVLIILDGFGISLEARDNPVLQAKKPVMDEFDRMFPFTALQASGPAVGLPWGEAGNSEVGHLTIGSGRIIYHHLPRIISSIRDGSFYQNPAFLKARDHVRAHNSRLHIAGLLSSGSVHSYIDHLFPLLEFAKRENIAPVFVHAFTDGKDAPPENGARFLESLCSRMASDWPTAKIASVIGRFYAMDRDEKWDRIHTAYALMIQGKGEISHSAAEYLRALYAKDITDEFAPPAMVGGSPEECANSRIKENDALIFFNYREDSMREITHAFTDAAFDKFPREKIPNLFAVTMTEYQEDIRAHVAFPPLDITQPLARVLENAGLKQLHIAETEKYAHVTYFFNGGKETLFPGEERVLVPSIATVHFDDVPQMRAEEITAKILENFGRFDVIIANLANADIVGHTGNFTASIAATEALDESLGKIANAIFGKEGIMVITADHGNIELKRNIATGEKRTQHSLNPVPFYIIGDAFKRSSPRTPEEIKKQKQEVGGILSDVAPTIIELLELIKPEEMTGQSLLGSLLKQVD